MKRILFLYFAEKVINFSIYIFYFNYFSKKILFYIVSFILINIFNNNKLIELKLINTFF